MSERQGRDILFAVAVHGGRFVVIMLGLWLAPLIGITGWYMGLFANALCCIYAAVLVTRLRLWKRIGMLAPWRGWLAVAALIPLTAEALFWMLPPGLVEQPPGFGLWALTLLMVGFNEELISRGVVLDRLSRSFSPVLAVTLTAALFGLQHLSLFATSDRGALDILGNIVVSAATGFALAAFQYRFAWIWPLILMHGFADFTVILGTAQHGDAVIAVTAVLFVLFGLVVLRRHLRRTSARPQPVIGR
ncbi:CPBP family intramembrane glutamic endopeptidase [Salinibacterium sp. ZJ454]|uniref:CPBP family intramembrane glutamic endopeptidase n=1 Tax=Salinibacterium sp. ZJ454 TaxID=2708339 RepID=UPI00142310CB|nr:CPBP family intramembrane glutamic endopeptidase [Salinibacterium sp. ZJ454]